MDRAGLTAAGFLVAVLGGMSTLPAAAASAPPPPDSSAVAGITLCNRSGQQITSGSVMAQPLAWRAVDATAAPNGYGKGGTATLLAYQVRPGVPPGDWSGEQLTASARYSNPAHPTAAATPIDESLATFLGDYPLSATGLVQLRIYLGSPGQPPYALLYDASYLSVSNGSWTQLNPGSADCSSAGRSVSLETVNLPKKDLTPTAKPKPRHTSGSSAASPGASGGPTASTSSNGNGSGGVGAAGLDNASASSTTSHTGRNLAIVIGIALLVAVSGGLALRRRT
jgi:hypothetical protein